MPGRGCAARSSALLCPWGGTGGGAARSFSPSPTPRRRVPLSLLPVRERRAREVGSRTEVAASWFFFFFGSAFSARSSGGQRGGWGVKGGGGGPAAAASGSPSYFSRMIRSVNTVLGAISSRLWRFPFVKGRHSRADSGSLQPLMPLPPGVVRRARQKGALHRGGGTGSSISPRNSGCGMGGGEMGGSYLRALCPRSAAKGKSCGV